MLELITATLSIGLGIGLGATLTMFLMLNLSKDKQRKRRDLIRQVATGIFTRHEKITERKAYALAVGFIEEIEEMEKEDA